jgi:serine kinase of HPr protein (carbohydrate metabolism regulator)
VPELAGAVEYIHATAIAVGGRGVLIRGPSGSGKSDLALRCLGLGPSAFLQDTVKLVADDQVMLTRERDALIATAPAALRGRLEVRGVGILEVATAAQCEVVLVADLVSDGVIERLPDPWPKAIIGGFEVPLIRLRPFEASAPLKLIATFLKVDLPHPELKA